MNIAKKFKVSHDDLLAANHIDDPRKLKIGQKLIIPTKAAKGKESERMKIRIWRHALFRGAQAASLRCSAACRA